MNAKTKMGLAIVLAVGPMLIAWVMHVFGTTPVAVHWQGTLLEPKGVGLEVRNIGLVFVLASLIGCGWLAYLVMRLLFGPRDTHGTKI